jgi:hypothetical protein
MSFENNYVILNGDVYHIGVGYLFASDIGYNPDNYPRLNSLLNEDILIRTGLSANYPGYLFTTENYQIFPFNSVRANIYKLTITKI